MTSSDDYLVVADAVECLPEAVRAELAQGPLDEPACRICRVLHTHADHHPHSDAATVMRFHELGSEELAEAALDALGKDRRLTPDEMKIGKGLERKLERMPETNVQRVAVEALAENIMWYRCLYVYMLAGWRP